MTEPWGYFRACSDVLAAAREEDPRRAIDTCACGALFLTPAGILGATECRHCFNRYRREADENADRELYLRWKETGGGWHPFPEPEREVEVETTAPVVAQGSLF